MRVDGGVVRAHCRRVQAIGEDGQELLQGRACSPDDAHGHVVRQALQQLQQ